MGNVALQSISVWNPGSVCLIILGTCCHRKHTIELCISCFASLNSIDSKTYYCKSSAWIPSLERWFTFAPLKYSTSLALCFTAALLDICHLFFRLAQPYLNSSSNFVRIGEGKIPLVTFQNVNLLCQQLPCYMFLIKVHAFCNLGACCEIWKLQAVPG